jgi:hypothetical protein
MEERREISKKGKVLLPSFVIVAIFLVSIVMINEVNAEEPAGRKCLIIVSGYGGYSSTELGKASSFHDHLNYTDEDEMYLTGSSDPETDGPANISNVEDAFDWLQTNSISSDEVIIYISDHEKRVLNESYFLFDDGNISTDMIVSWLDQVQCSNLTIILNGERSGLGGYDLWNASRVVICSMGPEYECDPDLFNITRSLEDPLADQNDDGVVDYIEAFRNEREIQEVLDQGPILIE